MSFDERNAAWSGDLREFRQVHSRNQVPRVWKIQVADNIIFTSWGQLGGAMQSARDILQGVNIGKKNEMTAQAYALDRAKELCRKKHWEGYREYLNGQPMDPPVEATIDFDNLPLNLSFYKPENTMGSGITKKAEARKVLYARKRNGLMYVFARGTGPVKMYSRRMLRQHDDEQGSRFTWNDRFPHLIEVMERVVPENSIFLGELVMDRDGMDDMKHVQSVTKSLTPQSLADQAAKGYPSFYVWDIAFFQGQDLVSKSPVQSRYELIHELDYESEHVIPVHYFDGNVFAGPAPAVEFAKQMKWEGFVVVDPEGIYGDRAYNFKGKPDRPGTSCAKLKPTYEDDFVAYWDPEKGYGERSTKGRYGGGIKNVALFQYNSRGELVYISNVNSGLTEEQKKNLANPALYPMVFQVEYKDRRYQSQGDDTNALDFAAVVDIRTDKRPEECVNPEL